MFRLLLIGALLLLFTACDENKPTKRLDGKRLLEQKCASCHDLHMPPRISDDELAPPMMSVSFHVFDFVEPSDESQRSSKAIEFVVDYVHEPSLEKSFCDEKSLQRYGLMPSQKERVTTAEAKAIAVYMFKHYTPQELATIQKERALFDALPPGERVALKYKCVGCHRVDRKVIGPSFSDIAKRHSASKEKMKQSIKDGSKERWKDSNGAIMPPFKQISDEELTILSEWILSSGV